MKSCALIYDLPLQRYPDDCEWEEKALDQLAEIVGGGTPDTHVDDFWYPAEIPWATPTDITSANGDLISDTARYISQAGLKQSTLIPERSVLVTTRATIGEAKINSVPMAINQGFAAFIPQKGCDPVFLSYLISLIRGTLVRLGAGTTFLETSRREIKKIRVKLPSEKEQSRISSTLKNIDESIDGVLLEYAALAKLKDAWLNAAFSRGIPSKKTQYQDSRMGKIPRNWKIKTIKSVLFSAPESGISPRSRPEPPGTPILNVSCVKNGICNPDKVTFVDVEPEDIERYKAKKGDFYVLRGNGNRDYVATGGWLREELPESTIYSDKLIRLVFDPDQVAEGFIPYLWQSYQFRTRLQSKAESGSGLWMISKRDIVKELFACPPIEEQIEIIEVMEAIEQQLVAVSRKLEVLDSLKKTLLQNLMTGKVRIPEEAFNA